MPVDISIVAVVWNRTEGDRISGLTRSVLRQTAAPHSLFIIDTSNNQERSESIYKSIMVSKNLYKDCKTRINYIHIPIDQMNLARMENIGISLTSTRYVGCVGSDIMFGRTFIEIANQRIGDGRLVLSELGYLDKDTDILSSTDEQLETHVDIDRIGERWASGAIQIGNTEWFRSIGGYDESFYYGGEDCDMMHRARMDNKSIEWIRWDEAKLFHIWHEVPKERNSTGILFMSNDHYVKDLIRNR